MRDVTETGMRCVGDVTGAIQRGRDGRNTSGRDGHDIPGDVTGAIHRDVTGTMYRWT